MPRLREVRSLTDLCLELLAQEITNTCKQDPDYVRYAFTLLNLLMLVKIHLTLTFLVFMKMKGVIKRVYVRLLHVARFLLHKEKFKYFLILFDFLVTGSMLGDKKASVRNWLTRCNIENKDDD